VLSGYCMKSERITGILTAGILGEYHLCSKLHAEIIPELLAIIGTIHALAVAESLYAKYNRSSRILKTLLLAYRSASWISAWIALSLATIYIVLY